MANNHKQRTMGENVAGAKIKEVNGIQGKTTTSCSPESKKPRKAERGVQKGSRAKAWGGRGEKE